MNLLVNVRGTFQGYVGQILDTRDIWTMTSLPRAPVLCLPADSEELDWIQGNLGIWLLPKMIHDALKSPPQSLSLKFRIFFGYMPLFIQKTHFFWMTWGFSFPLDVRKKKVSGISIWAPLPLESVGTKPMLPTNPPNSNSLASLSKLWGKRISSRVV